MTHALAIRASAGRHGELRLGFERRRGTTVLSEQYSRVPLQVMRPVTDPTGAVIIYLLSPTGGIVQGDVHEITIRLGPGTRVCFTTQAATKVYGMDVADAHQRVRIHVGEGALLEYVPDPTILFARSDYRQDIEVVLDAGARFVFQEILMPGRTAHRETLSFRRYETRLHVRDADGLLLHERSDLRPSQSRLDEIGILDGLICWGSWYALGAVDIDDETWQDTVGRARPHLIREGLCTGGMTRLRRHGVAAKAVARRTEVIQGAFEAVSGLLYGSIGGGERLDLRKY